MGRLATWTGGNYDAEEVDDPIYFGIGGLSTAYLLEYLEWKRACSDSNIESIEYICMIWPDIW